MDSRAFLPLTPQDTSQALGIRVRQYAELADAIVVDLVANHGASTESLTTGGGGSAYGRYVKLEGRFMFVYYSPSLWARYGEPMWVRVYGDGWKYSADVHDKACQFMAEQPSRVQKEDGITTISLELPLGVEREDVVKSVTRFIGTLARKLGTEDVSTEREPAPGKDFLRAAAAKPLALASKARFGHGRNLGQTV